MAKRRSTFDQAGAAKRLVRLEVYEEVQRRLGPDRVKPPQPQVLILPGRIPEHEIAIAHGLLDAHVVAIDVDPLAVEEARRAGAEASLTDLATISFRRRPGQPPPPRFDFANVDTCSLVTTTEPNVPMMLNRAVGMSTLVAIWCSYGHEDTDVIFHAAYRNALTSNARLRTEHVAALPDAVGVRLIYLLDRMRQSAYKPVTVHKVWTYRDKAMPMFVALLQVERGPFKWDVEQGPVAYGHVFARDHRPRALRIADAMQSRAAASLCGISPAQLAAWKAVRTRKEQKRVPVHFQTGTKIPAALRLQALPEIPQTTTQKTERTTESRRRYQWRQEWLRFWCTLGLWHSGQMHQSVSSIVAGHQVRG